MRKHKKFSEREMMFARRQLPADSNCRHSVVVACAAGVVSEPLALSLILTLGVLDSTAVTSVFLAGAANVTFEEEVDAVAAATAALTSGFLGEGVGVGVHDARTTGRDMCVCSDC
jgi:hypothetical protein